MPIPHPPNLTPFAPPHVAIVVNEWWFSILYGLLEKALGRWNWEVTDLEWVDVEQAIIELMVYMSSCEPICDIQELPNGTISYTQGGVTKTINTIEQVLPNIPDDVEILDQGVDPRDNICAAVFQLIDYIVEIVDGELDEAQLHLDGLKSLKLAIETIIESIFFATAEALPLDEIAAWVLNQNQILITLGKNHNEDEDFINPIKKDLYCRIRANGNIFDFAIWTAWLDDTVAPLNPSSGPWTFKWDNIPRNHITYSRIRNRYALFSYDEENDCRLEGWCDDDWCHLFDFTLGDELGWEPHIHSSGQPNAEWDSNKWVAVDIESPTVPGRTFRWLRIMRDIPGDGIAATKITITYDLALCPVCGGSPTFAIEFYLEGVKTSIPISVTEGSFQVSVLVVDEYADHIKVNFNLGWRDGAPPAGAINVHKVEICGVLEDPF